MNNYCNEEETRKGMIVEFEEGLQAKTSSEWKRNAYEARVCDTFLHLFLLSDLLPVIAPHCSPWCVLLFYIIGEATDKGLAQQCNSV